MRFALDSYSEHQIGNWVGSKKIEVYRGDPGQILDFVRRSLTDPTLRKKLYFGRISPELAQAIRLATGVETEGMNLALFSDEVSKIIRDHGSDTVEGQRGQRAITEDDFVSLLSVVCDPDSISLSPEDRFGKPVIMFSKMVNGKHTVVTYVSDKHNDLRVQTMYSGQTKRSLATPMDEHASINTPEASSGTASTSSIATQHSNVNPDIRYALPSPDILRPPLSAIRKATRRNPARPPASTKKRTLLRESVASG